MFDSIINGIEFIKGQALAALATNSALYIPLQATTSSADNAERFDLQQGMLRFLKLAKNAERSNEAKVLLLLGDTGSGKSMFAENFYRHLWQQYQPGHAIPLWLPLPELKNPFGEAVEEVLLNLDFDKAQIAELKSQYQFIIIADGYDELHSWQNIYMSNHLAEWNAKVIVTCRSQAVYHIRDFEKYFTPYQDEQPLRHLLMRFFVAPFSENQIDLYLQQYQYQQQPVSNIDDDDNNDGNNPALTQTQLRAIPGLSELITTPFLLHLAVEALPDILTRFQNAEITQQSKLTLAALYDVFVERWFNRQVIKLIATGHIPTNEDFKPKLWQFCQALASKMHQQNISHVQYNNTTKTAKKSLFAKNKSEATNPWADFFSAENTILRSGCPLRQFGENTYGFVHASFVEYFATRAMYKEIITECENFVVQPSSGISTFSDNSLVLTTPPTLIDNFHYRLFTREANAIGFMADRVQQFPQFKAVLFKHIELSKTDKRYEIGAANAITILNRAGVCFSGMSFKGIHVAHAYLANSLLNHTDFEGADLSYVNFKNSCLEGTNLQLTTLKEIDFEEQAYIQQSEAISSISLSSDGLMLAIANGKNIEIWNRQISQKLHTLRGHTHKINHIIFFSSGNNLISCSDDKTIRLWDTNTGLASREPIVNGAEISYIALSSDNKIYAHGMRSTVGLVSLVDDRTSDSWLVSEGINCISFSPDNQFMAACGNEAVHPTIFSLDLSTDFSRPIKKQNFHGHSKPISCLNFSHDSRLVITGSHDKSIRVWDIHSGKSLRTINDAHPNSITSLALSHDSSLLATGGEDHRICVWEPASGKILGSPLTGHTNTICSLTFTHDAKMLLSGSLDSTVRQWHIKSEQPKITESMEYHKGTITCIAASSDGKQFASGGKDNTILIWNIGNSNLYFQSLQGTQLAITSLAYSPDDNTLASGSVDHTVCLWDISTSKLFEKPLCGHSARVTCLAFSSNGTKLASGSMDETVLIWDMTTKKICYTIRELHYLSSITFSLDCTKLVACTWGPSVRVWNIATNSTLEMAFPLQHKVSHSIWSPNKKILAISHGNTIHLWDNLKQHNNNSALTGHTDYITCLTFTSDSQLLASGSLDQTIRLWSFPSGKSLYAPLESGGKSITSLSFVNNTTLISAYQDNALRLWQHTLFANGREGWLTLWRSQPYSLQLLGANINDAVELSVANKALILQRIHKIKPANTSDANNVATLHQPQANNPDGINIASNSGNTDLFMAAKNNYPHLVYVLLKAGAEVNQANTENMTPLYIAAAYGHLEVLQILIHAGADIHKLSMRTGVNDCEQTPLHIATENGHIDVVRELLKVNADVYQLNSSGYSPLCLAAEKGYIEIAKLLINANADINLGVKSEGTVLGKYMHTPLFIATRRSQVNMVKLLIAENADINKDNPLSEAAGNGHTELVQILMNANANIEQTHALATAAQNGHTEVVKLLLHANANVDNGNPLGNAITKRGPIEIIQLLIQANADVNNGALRRAAWAGRLDIAELLINANANINERRWDGTTPLLEALEGGHPHVAKLLIKANADVSLASNDGTTPLSKAIENGLNEIAELIRNKLTATQDNLLLTAAPAVATDSSTTWQRAPAAAAVTISSANVFTSVMETTLITLDTASQPGVLSDNQRSISTPTHK